MTDDEMLASLRKLLARAGALSDLIIDEAEGCPSSSAFQSRFGNLLRAYHLVGYTPDRDYRYVEINRALRRLHPGVIASVIEGIKSAGGNVSGDATTELLTINSEFSVSVVIARCRPHVEITRSAFEATLDIFQHAGLITKRHAYEDVVALPPAS